MGETTWRTPALVCDGWATPTVPIRPNPRAGPARPTTDTPLRGDPAPRPGSDLRPLVLAGQGLLGPRADDPDDPPPLELRQRAGLHDLDDVAQVGLVRLVVTMADGASPEHLAVLGMREEGLDLDPSGLVHLVGRHDPDLRLAPRAFGRGSGG